MGCISSKFIATTDLDPEISAGHVVSLTSTTYGVLNLDRNSDKKEQKQEEEEVEEEKDEEKQSYIMKAPKINPPPVPLFTPQSKKRILKVESPAEIINTWELMKDLSSPAIIKPSDLSSSPRNQKRRLLLGGGKENCSSPRDCSTTPNPNRVLRPFTSSSANSNSNRQAVDDVKGQKLEKDRGGSKRCLTPLFDPDMVVDSFVKELNKQGNNKVVVVCSKPIDKKARDARILLESFEDKCPPGGENALVLYTTTLRGIRKTFEDCNVVRSGIEAYDVKVVERDISMDSGFREELRELLMGKLRIPLLFVKGRLIGGAEEVLKLEEEGKLEVLLEGIPKREDSGCSVCGGMRFVMCRECNGSCKVLDDEEKKMVKCDECNENGLIHCPLCC